MRPLIIALALSAAAPVLAAAAPAPSPIAQAIADPARPKENVEADAIRKPADTLAFAGVRPGMIVGEFYPGSGYFTQLISDAVGPEGRVYAIENEKWQNEAEAKAQILSAPGHWTNVSVISRPFGTVEFPQPLDLAWVTQNYHDLKISKYGVVDTMAFDRAVYAALKPGGIFFVLDHDGKAGMGEADIEKMHRINKQQVIDEVTSAGFKLVEEGGFLRNPADDHSLPVFDKAIRGHTDQYALKFVKPAR
jgi:predicted methyltransferase